MMHRCNGNMMGQCSCGMYQTNSFTMLFQADHHHHHMYPFPSSSSSVDCTLSLGTPSTRLCEDQEVRHETHHRPSSSSSFCWDILQTHKNPSSQTHKTTRPTNTTNNNNNSNADPLLARRCANCDTTSTPLWRNGPRGPKSLCNACGIRFKKEERRATAANGSSSGSSSSGTMMEQQNYYGYNSNNQQAAAQKIPCYYSPAANNNEFRFIEESDHHLHHHHRDSDSSSSAIPFLSWRLNVTDRPSLVHDFTR